MSTGLGQTIERQPTTRTDLARQLLARVDRFMTRSGDVSLAAEVQLLKRELGRGGANLSARSQNNDLRSVITLVEAALT